MNHSPCTYTKDREQRIHAVINSTQHICWRILNKYITSILFGHKIYTERGSPYRGIYTKDYFIIEKKEALKFVLEGELKIGVYKDEG